MKKKFIFGIALIILFTTFISQKKIQQINLKFRD